MTHLFNSVTLPNIQLEYIVLTKGPQLIVITPCVFDICLFCFSLLEMAFCTYSKELI